MQQTSSAAPATGELVGTFRYGKGLKIFTIIFSVTLLAVAGFVLYLSTILPVDSSGPASITLRHGTQLQFKDGASMMYFTSAVLVLSALGVVALYLSQSRYRQSSYELFEQGIAWTTKGERTYLPFTEIEDLYLFASGKDGYSGLINNLAFRCNASEPFHRVVEPLKGFFEFQQQFRERYLDARQPAVLHTLQAGGTVTFQYVSTSQVWLKRMLGNFLDLKTSPIQLSRDYLQVEGRQVPIASLRNMDTSAWSERVVIKDAAGNTVLSTVATGILNMDLFLNTLALLMEAHAHAEVTEPAMA